jgi:hypothetical protein
MSSGQQNRAKNVFRLPKSTPMKKVLSVLFTLLAFAVSGSAQSEKQLLTQEFYFIKEIAVSSYKEQNFRYEIAVQADNPADITVQGVPNIQGKKDYQHSDFKIETRREQEWIIYTVIGKVPANASGISFYAAVNKGKFYFDDVSFYVEKAPGQWKQVRLYNHSFEETTPDIFAGYLVNKRESETLKTGLANDIYKTGNHSLFVEVGGDGGKRFATVK